MFFVCLFFFFTQLNPALRTTRYYGEYPRYRLQSHTFSLKFARFLVGCNQSFETQITMMKCTNAGGRTKGANEKSIVLVHQHGRDDVT